MVAYGRVLSDHREAIDSLNVFPVPDGDTGTNMALTVASVLKHIDDQEAADLLTLCQAISHGSLRGARGNSGVILSQILRGLCQSFEEQESVTTESLARGWEIARSSAYKAVLEPKEGTILTVLTDIASQAEHSRQQGHDLVELAKSCLGAGQQSLDRTPELLEVLAEAGVVDAGGAGLVLFWDAVLTVVSDHNLPEAPQPTGGVGQGTGQAGVAGSSTDVGPASDSSHTNDQRYEVMFFLETQDDAAIEPFRQRWSEIGDSIVVVGGAGLWNCHIHTNQIGESIEAGIEVGRPSQIRITDLFEQVEHLESDMHQSLAAAASGTVPAASGTTPSGQIDSPTIWRNPAADPNSKCAVVCVANGGGIIRLLGELNVHSVVLGGQTMNPSTELILEALEGVEASEVVLQPNNKNIIPVASQAAQSCDKEVQVLPSSSIPEGVASLVVYDPNLTARENLKAMEAEVADLVVGQVTQAVRETSVGGQKVGLGDFIGISGSEIMSVSEELTSAVCGLLSEIIQPDHELLMLFVGEPADQSTTQAVLDWVEEHHGSLEVERHNGGQLLYHYYLSLF